MSTLIEKLNNYNTLDIINYYKIKEYYTIYFDNNIDFRMCSKNACTTIKYVFMQLHYNIDATTHLQRRKFTYHKLLKAGKIEPGPLQFRKDSYRIAVKRDPIERALSAAKYILLIRLNIPNPSIDMIEELLMIADIKIDEHFCSQSLIMGHPDSYNKIYNMDQVDNFISFLESNYNWPGSLMDSKKNISENKTSVNDLSDEVINKLKVQYKIDYDNGWY